MDQESIEKLERHIDDLMAACQRLKSENRMLKASQKTLSDAHARLNDKTQSARERIELMINRLKALERSQ